MLSLGCICCGRTDEDVVYAFSVTNDSGREISITSFKADFPEIAPKQVSLKNKEVLLEEFPSRDSGRSYSFLDVFDGDSINVDYAGSRFQIITCIRRGSEGVGCSVPRNILNVLPEPVSGTDILLSEYVFTAEDFNTAQPLE